MSDEILVVVPGAEVHKVENSVQHLLSAGDLVISLTGAGDGQAVSMQVGATQWNLGKHLPALKAAPTIYSFGLEHTRHIYYCLILPHGTPPAALEAVEDVISSSCALTTARQVDAAYEAADALQGGKEAARAATLAAAAEALGGGKGGAADRVASGLIAGGGVVAGLVKKASCAVTGALTSYCEKNLAAPPPGAPGAPAAQVSPHFRRGLKVAAVVASTAAYVTGKLAALVGDASYALALRIAKTMPGHTDAPAAAAAGPAAGGGGAAAGAGSELAPAERSAFKTVGAAGLAAYVEVYDALEEAAKAVLSHSAVASAEYINYKYGPEAGAAAADSVPVAQDMIQAATNFTRLGARAMISKTAKVGP
ncbi:MAG: senescence-associated protein-domain-containing protein [Monoraphidium minutum]|nr:MAG: senescence-associated protein-domain-containing protein [Monoraphidium minutum]